NGKEWRGLSRGRGGPKPPVFQGGGVKVGSADQIYWRVSFFPTYQDDRPYEAHAALLAKRLTPDIKKGEKRGRGFDHGFDVIALDENSLTPQEDKVSGEVSLAALEKAQASRLAIAIWVTLRGRLEPLQATGGWLPKP